MTTNPLTFGVDHIGLTVRDLNLSRDFFINCLGWVQTGERTTYPAAFVSDGHITLTLWEVKNHAIGVAFDRKTNVGLHHLALRVPTEVALDEVFAKVSEWPGVLVEFSPEKLGEGPKHHTMIYEPGGIRLEFNFDPRLQLAEHL